MTRSWKTSAATPAPTDIISANATTASAGWSGADRCAPRARLRSVLSLAAARADSDGNALRLASVSGFFSASCTGAGMLSCSSEVARPESLAVAAMFSVSVATSAVSSTTALRAGPTDRLELRELDARRLLGGG